MIYFPNHNATFIHIMKTGGSSFTHWVKNNLKQEDYCKYNNPLTHITLSEAKEIIPNTGKVFTFVRNPFARFVSMYFFLKKKKNATSDRLKDFPYFINKILDDRDTFEFIHTRSYPIIQYDFIKSDECIFIKLEKIDKQFAVIQDLFNCNKPLPHINKSSHGAYRKYYTPDLVNKMHDVLSVDFEKFNYEF